MSEETIFFIAFSLQVEFGFFDVKQKGKKTERLPRVYMSMSQQLIGVYFLLWKCTHWDPQQGGQRPKTLESWEVKDSSGQDQEGFVKLCKNLPWLFQ